MDRELFFISARAKVFSGHLTQAQVDGLNAILDYWAAHYPGAAWEWIAYCLATTWWETAHTMAPVSEVGHGAGRPYGDPDPETGETYYGRGLVQITWRDNYRGVGDDIGVDLLNEPSLALRLDIAVKILVEGMVNGWFTGRCLRHYFSSGQNDPIGARRIINGVDHAADISAVHRLFLAALRAASPVQVAAKPAAVGAVGAVGTDHA